MTDPTPPLSDLDLAPNREVLALGCPEAVSALRAQGFECRLLASLGDCQQALQAPRVRAIVLRLEGEALAEAVRVAHAEAPLVDILVWMPERSPEDVRVALQLGARDVVLGARPEALAKVVARVIERQRFLPRLQEFKLARSRSSRFEGLVTKSARMWELFETAIQVAPSGASVLVLGETGVGKELVARAIHKHSGREGRFVPLNCGSIPDGLIDSELFGHEEGTFTGATRSTLGLFRRAPTGRSPLTCASWQPPASPSTRPCS